MSPRGDIGNIIAASFTTHMPPNSQIINLVKLPGARELAPHSTYRMHIIYLGQALNVCVASGAGRVKSARVSE